MGCENVSRLARGRSEEKNVLVRVRCKMWGCSYCAKLNRQQWHYRIMRSLENMGERRWAFVTITAAGGERPNSLIIKELQAGISKLLKRMRRANKLETMDYLRVYERGTELFRWHAHFLISWLCADYGDYYGKNDDILIDTERKLELANERWLKDTCVNLELGYMADFKVVKTQYDAADERSEAVQGALQVTSYITKYLTKGIQAEVAEEKPRHLRMIQTSRSFPPALAVDVEADELDWTVDDSYMVNEFIKFDRGKMVDAERGQLVKLGDFSPESGNFMHTNISKRENLGIDKDEQL